MTSEDRKVVAYHVRQHLLHEGVPMDDGLWREAIGRWEDVPDKRKHLPTSRALIGVYLNLLAYRLWDTLPTILED